MGISKDILACVRLIILAFLIILGGLTIIASKGNQPKNYVWVKPDATDQDYRRDNYACLQESQQRVSGYSREGRSANASSEMQKNDSLYNACMQARGWSLEEEGAQIRMKKRKKSSDASTLSVIDSQNQNIEGKWIFKVYTSKRTAATVTMIFEQDGEMLSGQFIGKYGQADLTGTINGNEIMFTYKTNPQSGPANFSGQIDPANKMKMSGTVDYAGKIKGRWEGKKID